MFAEKGIFISPIDAPQSALSPRGEGWIRARGGRGEMHLSIRENKRIETRVSLGRWLFRSSWLPRRHHLISRFGALLPHWTSGRSFRIATFGFLRPGGFGLFLCDGGYRAGGAQKGSTNEGARWCEFQRVGRPIPTSRKSHAVVHPHHVANGRQATGRPGTIFSPQVEANLVQTVKES